MSSSTIGVYLTESGVFGRWKCWGVYDVSRSKACQICEVIVVKHDKGLNKAETFRPSHRRSVLDKKVY